jgi:MSHA biogenesis protein MshI
MQRSMDTVDRQFSTISLSRMVVALPPDSGLEEQFRNSIYLPFEAMDLARVMDISAFPELADPEQQRRALRTIGAALRNEERAA